MQSNLSTNTIEHPEVIAERIERAATIVGDPHRVSAGSKFRVEDIEPEMKAAADIIIDYGLSRYHNPQGRSSTMIDFRDFSLVREGVCFTQIRDVLRDEFGVELITGRTAR